MKRSTLPYIWALATCLSISALAQGLPMSDRPEDVGFSSERLKRLTQKFQQDVDKGEIPGAVVLIARKGKVAYFEAFGYQDREKRVPMKIDAIFRIASMTKPITSVALMMLAEEGKIDIGAEVSQYLPEFKDLKVGVEKIDADTGNPKLSLEAPTRPMTVQDLLRHTAGLTYGVFGKSLVKQAYLDAKVLDWDQTNAEMVTKLSKLPLAHQPGAVWDYSMSVDVLARIVEVVSGMEFDRYIEENITKPLGMADTGFYVTAPKVGRLAEPQVDPTTGKRPSFGDAIKKPKWISGGGGLVSTAGDYARFCQMLLNGGELGGVRLLSPKSVALMTADHVPPGMARESQIVSTMEDFAPTLEMGQSFGLGFGVRTNAGRNPMPGSAGDYFWAGIMGTYFWVDPKENLFAVLMIQLPFRQINHYRRLMRQLVYQALTG